MNDFMYLFIFWVSCCVKIIRDVRIKKICVFIFGNLMRVGGGYKEKVFIYSIW